MSGQDMADAVGVFIQLVIDIQHSAAGIAENGIDSLLHKHFHKNLGTVQNHSLAPS